MGMRSSIRFQGALYWGVFGFRRCDRAMEALPERAWTTKYAWRSMSGQRRQARADGDHEVIAGAAGTRNVEPAGHGKKEATRHGKGQGQCGLHRSPGLETGLASAQCFRIDATRTEQTPGVAPTEPPAPSPKSAPPRTDTMSLSPPPPPPTWSNSPATSWSSDAPRWTTQTAQEQPPLRR